MIYDLLPIEDHHGKCHEDHCIETDEAIHRNSDDTVQTLSRVFSSNVITFNDVSADAAGDDEIEKGADGCEAPGVHSGEVDTFCFE